MTDHFAGHHHHDVAELLETHHGHHGHGGKKWSDQVPAPRCHATHAGMAGKPSKQVENTVAGILANANQGTAHQRRAARSWAELHRLDLEKQTALSGTAAIHSFYT